MPRLSPLNNSGLAPDFGWRSASALRKDLPSSTNGTGTASAPEDLGRLPRKSLQRDCHPERSEGPAFVGGRGELWFVWHAADQLNLALDFGWRSASAPRKDLTRATNGRRKFFCPGMRPQFVSH